MAKKSAGTRARNTYEKIAAERQKRIQEHQARIVEIKAGRERKLNILADGDSWFNYVLSKDVIEWLREDGTPSPEILNLQLRATP